MMATTIYFQFSITAYQDIQNGSVISKMTQAKAKELTTTHAHNDDGGVTVSLSGEIFAR